MGLWLPPWNDKNQSKCLWKEKTENRRKRNRRVPSIVNPIKNVFINLVFGYGGMWTKKQKLVCDKIYCYFWCATYCCCAFNKYFQCVGFCVCPPLFGVYLITWLLLISPKLVYNSFSFFRTEQKTERSRLLWSEGLIRAIRFLSLPVNISSMFFDLY